jgi:hypothetical protein
MGDFELTKGAMLRFYQGHQPDSPPVVQVLDVKEIKDTGRYRQVP